MEVKSVVTELGPPLLLTDRVSAVPNWPNSGSAPKSGALESGSRASIDWRAGKFELSSKKNEPKVAATAR